MWPPLHAKRPLDQTCPTAHGHREGMYVARWNLWLHQSDPDKGPEQKLSTSCQCTASQLTHSAGAHTAPSGLSGKMASDTVKVKLLPILSVKPTQKLQEKSGLAIYTYLVSTNAELLPFGFKKQTLNGSEHFHQRKLAQNLKSWFLARTTKYVVRPEVGTVIASWVGVYYSTFAIVNHKWEAYHLLSSTSSSSCPWNINTSSAQIRSWWKKRSICRRGKLSTDRPLELAPALVVTEAHVCWTNSYVYIHTQNLWIRSEHRD